MCVRTRLLSVGVIVMLCLASASAKAKDGKEMLLRLDASAAGKQLSSGRYNVTWQAPSPSTTVTFLQHGKVISTAEARVEERTRKYPENQVVYRRDADGHRQIQEIRFRGSTEVIVFGGQ